MSRVPGWQVNLTWHEAAPKLLGLDPPADAEICSLPGRSSVSDLSGLQLCSLFFFAFWDCMIAHCMSLHFIDVSAFFNILDICFAFVSHPFHVLIILIRLTMADIMM